MTTKQKKYFLSRQRQMLTFRSTYLYLGLRRTPLLKYRRESITEFKDKCEHVAASLQHDLWS